jgi:hypothetical protein
LPESAADTFVETLVSHGDMILFSAAPVGQGGHDHINEQPYEYWRDKFTDRGYDLIDWLRGAIKDNRAVEPWYRYNMMFFVKRDLANDLPTDLVQFRVGHGDHIADVSSQIYKLRKLVVSQLPPWACFALAQSKKHSTLWMRRATGDK